VCECACRIKAGLFALLKNFLNLFLIYRQNGQGRAIFSAEEFRRLQAHGIVVFVVCVCFVCVLCVCVCVCG